MRSACVRPELASIGFGAIAGQGIGDEEHERRHAAGAEDAYLGEQGA